MILDCVMITIEFGRQSSKQNKNSCLNLPLICLSILIDGALYFSEDCSFTHVEGATYIFWVLKRISDNSYMRLSEAASLILSHRHTMYYFDLLIAVL